MLEGKAVLVVVNANRDHCVIVLHESNSREFVARPDVRLRRPTNERAALLQRKVNVIEFQSVLHVTVGLLANVRGPGVILSSANPF